MVSELTCPVEQADNTNASPVNKMRDFCINERCKELAVIVLISPIFFNSNKVDIFHFKIKIDQILCVEKNRRFD